MADRYEINHDGQIVVEEGALCSNLDSMLVDLFSQYGWNCNQVDKTGSCRKVELTSTTGEVKTYNVYCGTVRNEARNPYEKKIQLGTASDPHKKSKSNTIILGVYVFKANDTKEDAIFVGYPIDENIRYDTNPSIRGTFVNKLLIQAKTEGFVYDSEHNTVAFRSEFAFYYLQNYYNIHYTNNGIRKTSDAVRASTTIDISRNRIIFGAPGTGKSYTLNKDRKKLLGENNETDYERVTFHPDYSYANFVGTYKPVMVSGEKDTALDEDRKYVLSILNDESKTGQEKYDELFEMFKDEGLTRLPLLLGLYTDESFETKKKDGSPAVDSSVEKNHGRAIRKYVNLITGIEKTKDIAYEYVPGPFMRALVKALKSARTDNPKPYLLLIEEINRANVAAVFGDVFQLLDRGDDNCSEYPIEATEDMKKYLSKELDMPEECFNKIRIPDNMFIWATMNSADQGVFPMDTAFKRRWDFTYIGIDDNDTDLAGKKVVLGSAVKQKVEWNSLRKAINDYLAKQKINEDKQLGPYFISRKIVVPEDGDEIDSEEFAKVFKNKVIMYLFEDAAKQRRSSLFEGCFQNSNRYSEICKEFDEKGIGIFNHEIQLMANPEDIEPNTNVEETEV
ncbi:MAG: AAA family ATPase [Prevotellaceae bacterium]|nr:AAA family ATPase [Candidatus Faecinaster equi]